MAGSIPTGINGGLQTWVWATYNDRYNSQCGPYCLGVDVSEIGHDVAEWADDPFDQTPVDCPSIYNVLEVADPFIGVIQSYYRC
jgi:hypothetical protein